MSLEDKRIQDIIPVPKHQHDGIDTPRIPAQAILGVPQSAVTAPTGGVTQDTQARTAINDIITRLENLGFISPN